MAKKKKEKEKFNIGNFIKFFFIFLSVCAVPIYFHFYPDTPQSTIYCNEEDECFTYEKTVLTRYEREWIRKDVKNKDGNIRYIVKEKCHIEDNLKNDCDIDVKEVTDNKILIQRKNILYHYYNILYHYTKITNKQSILHKAYQNGKNEIYFLDEDNIIISSQKGTQRKYHYSISTYDDEFYTIYLNGIPSYSYNFRTTEILGFEEMDKEALQYILLDYYDEEGEILPKDEYLISGSYTIQSEADKKELYIYQNKVLLGTEKETEQKELKVIDVNDNEVYYSFEEDTPLFSYHFDTKELKSEVMGERVKEISKDQFKYIHFEFYNDDTSFKPIDVPYEGAYRYKEEISEKEILLKDGTIYMIEHYPRNPDYKKQDEYSYSPKYRTENEIVFSYKDGEEIFKYNILNHTIQIYELEYEKIAEEDLKYINP